MEKELSDQIIQRLDRVDKTLDTMSARLDGINKILVAQAKTEKDIVRLLENDDRHNKHIDSLEGEINVLKAELGAIRERQSALGVLERAAWVMFTALVAAVVGAVTWVKT